jgi:DNA-binding NarL/FixJ family response regulator
MKNVSILIADDHPTVRRGLQALLETQPDWKVVAAVSNGRDAVKAATKLRPDIVILDIAMPHVNGLDATRLILQSVPSTRILILTMYDAQELIEKTMEAGARGFLLKSDAEEDLVNSVKAVLHGKSFFTARTSLFNRRRRGLERNAHPPLTPREREVLKLIAEGRAHKEVASALGISKRTVENHRASIMTKLELHSLSELVRYAIRNKMVKL